MANLADENMSELYVHFISSLGAFMSSDNTKKNAVIFSDQEMDEFLEDASLDLSEQDLVKRSGKELTVVQVLDSYDEEEDLPPGVPREFHRNYSVLVDTGNPTMLIIEGEDHDELFRLSRTPNFEEIEVIIMQRNIDIKIEQEENEDYERDRIERLQRESNE